MMEKEELKQKKTPEEMESNSTTSTEHQTSLPIKERESSSKDKQSRCQYMTYSCVVDIDGKVTKRTSGVKRKKKMMNGSF